MIETRWWDALILYFRYENGRLELRLGAICLLVIVVVVWKAIRAMTTTNQDGPADRLS